MPSISSTQLQRLLDEAPFVGALARALAGRDADEVVQDTWLRAMHGGGHSVRRPRQWLAQIVRNVASNLHRGAVRREVHERAAARTEPVPSSAELMEREERRRELVCAVDALPTALRDVIVLRFLEDLPPRVIAERLGLRATTVTSRLRTALESLRGRLDERHVDRRVWLLPLLPTRSATPVVATGVLALSAKTKLIAAAGMLAALALVLWTTGGRSLSPPPGSGTPGQPPPFTARVPGDDEHAEKTATGRREVEMPTPAVAPMTGALIVKATHGEDAAPAPDLLILVGRGRGDYRFDYRRVRTDAAGIAEFAELEPGRWTVRCPFNPNLDVAAQIDAGAETRLEMALPSGILLRGVVVDSGGVAVPGAEVYTSRVATAWVDAELAAITGIDGRYTLRSCPTAIVIGARAAGHAPSRMSFVLQESGSKELRIVLPDVGGDVEGSVFGPDGAPMPGAVVLVGDGLPSRIEARLEGAPPIPAQVRTDLDGHFRAIGIAAGEQPLRVLAAQLAPWTGTCQVEPGLVTAVEVRMGQSLSCTGFVVDSKGEPMAGVGVETGKPEEWSYFIRWSAQDGSFRFDGLSPGEIELRTLSARGTASATVRGGPGETVSCTLQLDAGRVLHGRVLTTENLPVKGAFIRVSTARSEPAPRSSGYAHTDAEGRFTLTRAPESRLLDVHITGAGIRDKRLDDVVFGDDEVLIHVDAAPPPSARIVGTLVDPDGLPVTHASVIAFGPDANRTGAHGETSGAGRFELASLVPGTWLVLITAEGHPEWATEWHAIAPESTWDLGTVRLAAGGTIRVRLHAAEGRQPRLSLGDATLRHWASIYGEGDELRSEPVVPGPHFIKVSGEGVAARWIPVEVKVGEEREVEISIEAGLRQRFEIVAPAPLSELHLRVLRGDEVVVEALDRALFGQVIQSERSAWLAPGEYRVEVRGDGRSDQARFTLAQGAENPVRIVLR